MKTLLHKTIILTLATIFGLSIIATTTVTAADDPSIKGVLREDIKSSMMSFIDSNMINDKYYIYDAVGGRLLDLKFAKLHEGIVGNSDSQSGHSFKPGYVVRNSP